MKQDYYIDEQYQQQGPIDESELIENYKAGKYRYDTKVWCDGMTDWQKIPQVMNDLGIESPASVPPSIETKEQQSSIGDALSGVVGAVKAKAQAIPVTKEDMKAIGDKVRDIAQRIPKSKYEVKSLPLKRKILFGVCAAAVVLLGGYALMPTADAKYEVLIADYNDASRVKNMTPLWAAVATNDMGEAIKCIENGADLEIRVKLKKDDKYDDGTPLILASRMGNIAMVKMLLKKGAKLDTLGGYGETALCQAVKKSNALIVEILIDAGANLDFNAPSGLSPLMAAASENDVKIAKTLVDAGAEIDKLGENGSALTLAAMLGNKEVASYLIESDAEVDVRGVSGATPLSWAVLNGQVGLVRLLLKAGADTQIPLEYQGKEYTPLQTAERIKNLEIIQILVDAD